MTECKTELVGRKVKIYFEGNYTYLEAEVFEYAADINKHRVKFLCDGDDSMELLDPTNSKVDWYIFDTSLPPPTIKKRASLSGGSTKVSVFDGDNGDLDHNGNVIVNRSVSPKLTPTMLESLQKKGKVRRRGTAAPCRSLCVLLHLFCRFPLRARHSLFKCVRPLTHLS